MRLRLSMIAIVRSVVFVALLAPVRVVAQDETYFQTLAVPPRFVGTCVAMDPRRAGNGVLLKEAHLVMTAVAPNRRREIMIYSDTLGRVIGLSEFEFVSTGLLSQTADQVVANIDAVGRTVGFHDHNTIQMSDSGIVRFDTVALRRMNEHAVRRSSHEALDGTAQLKVRKLVDWMRTRCKL
ncbi:MAG TPA: hypothetical protein VII02_04165 [Gemmatimonadaceae bacterium]